MTKKDYILIADAIHSVEPHGNLETLLHVIASLSIRFNTDNPRFDERTFKKACLGLAHD